MSEDWEAVAQAIQARMTELGINQRELIERSGISGQTVSEIQWHSRERHRAHTTLEALSEGLGWHRQHLSALLRGRRPPAIGDPRENLDDPISARLSTIEGHLSTISDRLSALEDSVDEIAHRLRDSDSNH